MNTDKKKLVGKTIRGTIWVYISKYSAKIVVFISTTILARLLTKDDFGVAGYALLAITFIDFVEGLGIRQALIYFDEEDERTNAGFWAGLFVGVTLLAVGLVVVAPIAGWYFQDPRAVGVTRAMAFSMPITSLALVHNALVEKKLDFKKRVLPDLSNALGKGIISITFAFLGFGAWSLIAGQLVGAALSVIMFWVIVPWRPRLSLARAHVRPLISYGSQIIYNSGLSTLLINLDYLLVGRYMNAAVLGVYTLAFRIPELLIKQFSGILGKVIFPVYATMRGDRKSLTRGFLLTTQYVNLITVPLGIGLALVSESAILLFFGEKWLEGAPVMFAISIYSMLRAVPFNAGNVYKAIGRPGLLVQIHIGQAIVSIPALWWAVAVAGSIEVVAWTQVGLVLVAGVVKLIIAMQVLDTSVGEIVKVLRPSFVSGGIMAVAVWGSMQLTTDLLPILQLIIHVSIGAVVYFSALWVLYRDIVLQAIELGKGAVPKKKRT